MTMYVITHKQFDHQLLPSGYVPLLVGAVNKENPDSFLVDDLGENISSKNTTFCEETGLYWLWKHAKDDKIGLSHYRRFFVNERNRKSMFLKLLINGKAEIITLSDLNNYLDSGYQWILSQPEHGGDGTIWDQFATNHHIHDLEITEKIIGELTPDYSEAFTKVVHQNSTGSFYNMFYTTHDEMVNYSEWLFKILFAVEKQTDITDYNAYQKRLYGFLAERLLNVWVYRHHCRVKYLPVVETEKMDRKYVLQKIRDKF